jgi:hypothetical protein
VHNARVIEQDIQLAELRFSCAHHALGIRRFRHIGVNIRGTPARCRDLAHHCLPGGVVHIGYHNCRALTGPQQGSLAANPRTSAGD